MALKDILHADVQSEKSLIGAIVVDPRCIPAVSLIVGGDDFADQALGRCFNAICIMHAAGKPVHDPRYLISQAAHLGLGEQRESVASLTSLLKDAPTSAVHADYFAHNILEKKRLRGYEELVARVSGALGSTTAKSEDVRAVVETSLGRIATGGQVTSRRISDLMESTLDKIQAMSSTDDLRAIETGIEDLDEAMGPIMGGEVCVIAARPGCGKTSLGWQITKSVASAGKRALFVSLEMGSEELLTRHLCQKAKLNSKAIRGGRAEQHDLDRLRSAGMEDMHLPIWIASPARSKFSEIAAEANFLRITDGVDAVVVDYLGLIEPEDFNKTRSRYEIVTEASRKIKQLAKELNCPILELCQLSRQASDGPPIISHLRESGAIEQDADMVLLIDIPQKRGEEVKPRDDGAMAATITIAKHRHGQTGSIPLLFWGAAQKFTCPPKGSNYSFDLAESNR